MSEHATFLGDIADWVDTRINRLLTIRDRQLAWIDTQGHVTGRNHPYLSAMSLNPIALAIVGQNVGWIHVRGAVDTLRIGDGVRAGGWGYAQDALRVVSLIGPAGRVVGAIRRAGVLAVQSLGTTLCGFVAPYNAQIRTGYNFFVNLDDLIRSSNLGRIPGAIRRGLDEFQLENLLAYLRQLGIPVRNFTLSGAGAGWTELERLVASSRRGVFLVPFHYIRNGGASAGHILEVIYHPAHGLRFLDTTGDYYNGVRAFLAAYPEARIARNFSIAFVPDSSLIARGSAVATGAARTTRAAAGADHATGIVLPVVPIVSPPQSAREAEAAAARVQPGR
jgi:hypothetical protein